MLNFILQCVHGDVILLEFKAFNSAENILRKGIFSIAFYYRIWFLCYGYRRRKTKN